MKIVLRSSLLKNLTALLIGCLVLDPSFAQAVFFAAQERPAVSQGGFLSEALSSAPAASCEVRVLIDKKVPPQIRRWETSLLPHALRLAAVFSIANALQASPDILGQSVSPWVSSPITWVLGVVLPLTGMGVIVRNVIRKRAGVPTVWQRAGLATLLLASILLPTFLSVQQSRAEILRRAHGYYELPAVAFHLETEKIIARQKEYPFTKEAYVFDKKQKMTRVIQKYPLFDEIIPLLEKTDIGRQALAVWMASGVDVEPGNIGALGTMGAANENKQEVAISASPGGALVRISNSPDPKDLYNKGDTVVHELTHDAQHHAYLTESPGRLGRIVNLLRTSIYGLFSWMGLLPDEYQAYVNGNAFLVQSGQPIEYEWPKSIYTRIMFKYGMQGAMLSGFIWLLAYALTGLPFLFGGLRQQGWRQSSSEVVRRVGGIFSVSVASTCAIGSLWFASRGGMEALWLAIGLMGLALPFLNAGQRLRDKKKDSHRFFERAGIFLFGLGMMVFAFKAGYAGSGVDHPIERGPLVGVIAFGAPGLAMFIVGWWATRTPTAARKSWSPTGA